MRGEPRPGRSMPTPERRRFLGERMTRGVVAPVEGSWRKREWEREREGLGLVAERGVEMAGNWLRRFGEVERLPIIFGGGVREGVATAGVGVGAFFDGVTAFDGVALFGVELGACFDGVAVWGVKSMRVFEASGVLVNALLIVTLLNEASRAGVLRRFFPRKMPMPGEPFSSAIERRCLGFGGDFISTDATASTPGSSASASMSLRAVSRS